MADAASSHLGRAARDIGQSLDDRLELLPILATLNGLDRGTDELYAVALENAILMEGHRRVQRCLATECGQQGVWPLFRDDHLDELRGNGLDVGRISELRIGHDRRRVGVDQDHSEAFIPEHSTSLGTGVVELASLPNDNRSGSNDEDRFDVMTSRHYAPADSRRSRSSRISATNLSKR